MATTAAEKDVLEALRAAADGYQAAASYLWEFVDRTKPATRANVEALVGIIHRAETQGQLNYRRAVELVNRD